MKIYNEIAKGFLHVITTPVSGDIYINGEYRGTFDLNIEVDPGTYIVSFGHITGYVTPSPLTIIINSGYETIVTVQYVK